jgi:hypothetical protein
MSGELPRVEPFTSPVSLSEEAPGVTLLELADSTSDDITFNFSTTTGGSLTGLPVAPSPLARLP